MGISSKKIVKKSFPENVKKQPVIFKTGFLFIKFEHLICTEAAENGSTNITGEYKMRSSKSEPVFHAYYREPGPLPRKACNHKLFQAPDRGEKGHHCQFAKIDTYLFGLTKTGLDMFKSFLDDPKLLVSKYGWNEDVIDEIIQGEGWTGERLSYSGAMERMKNLADVVANYDDGSILFMFSRNKVDFNVEVYSTEGLDFIEGFIIASIDSENFQDYFSLIINEVNIIEIECDYGLNEPPDANPWNIRYYGRKLTFGEHEIYPE